MFSVLQAQQFEKMSVEDGVIQLEVFLAESLLGLYTINCRSNTLGPVASGGQVTLLVLDSKELCVTEYKPKNISVGVEFQVRAHFQFRCSIVATYYFFKVCEYDWSSHFIHFYCFHVTYYWLYFSIMRNVGRFSTSTVNCV